MSIGILGSGFGLYGYLPAINNLGVGVNLLSRTQDVLESRAELRHLKANIEFCHSEQDLIQRSDKIVLARTPSSQLSFIIKHSGQFEHLFLKYKCLLIDFRSC